MVIQVNLGHTLRSTPAAAPEPMQKAYVDFAKDCFRPQAENQSNPEQRRRPICSRLPRKYGTDGVRGKIQFIFPRAAFGSFRRDERNNVTEPNSMKMCTTPCNMVQFPAFSLSPFGAAPSRRELMCALMRLRGSAYGGLLPSSAGILRYRLTTTVWSFTCRISFSGISPRGSISS